MTAMTREFGVSFFIREGSVRIARAKEFIEVLQGNEMSICKGEDGFRFSPVVNGQNGFKQHVDG